MFDGESEIDRNPLRQNEYDRVVVVIIERERCRRRAKQVLFFSFFFSIFFGSDESKTSSTTKIKINENENNFRMKPVLPAAITQQVRTARVFPFG